eukprot:m51a1_g4053 hypothetical protein (182) ;mRNA; r:708590-709216
MDPSPQEVAGVSRPSNCPLCHVPFDLSAHDPRVLDCLHTICSLCAGTLADRARQECSDSVRCPIDSVPTPVALSTSRRDWSTLERVLSTASDAPPKAPAGSSSSPAASPQTSSPSLLAPSPVLTGAPVCSVAPRKCQSPATSFCPECNKYLCTRCSAAHSTLFDHDDKARLPPLPPTLFLR